MSLLGSIKLIFFRKVAPLLGIKYGYISTLVEKRRREILNKKFLSGWSYVKNESQIQKWNSKTKITSSIFVVLALYVFAWLTGFLVHDFALFNSSIMEFVWTLLQVHVGILSVTFVVIVLSSEIIQSQQKQEESLTRLFLEESQLVFAVVFGLIVATSLTLISIPIVSPVVSHTHVSLLVIINVALFIWNLILTGSLYIKAYESLQPSYWDKVVLHYLSDKIDDYLNYTYSRFIAKNIIEEHIQKLGYSSNLSYLNKNVRLSTPEQGYIEDIMVNYLFEQLQELFSDIPVDENSNMQISFTKLYGDTIKPYDNMVLLVSPELYSIDLVEVIRKSFVIRSQSNSSSFEQGLLYLEERIKYAISLQQETRVMILIEEYRRLSARMIDLFESSSTSTRYEKIDLNALGNISEKLRESSYRLFEGLNTQNERIIMEIVNLPSRIIVMAIEKRNKFFTQTFLKSYIEFYHFINRKDVGAMISMPIIEEVFWNRLSTIFRHSFDILRVNSSQDDGSLKSILSFTDFAEIGALFLNKMIKIAIDNRDVNGYERFGALLDTIFSRIIEFVDNYCVYEISILEPQLLSSNISEDQKNEIEKRKILLSKIVLRIEDIKKTRLVIWFGVSAWILSIYETDEIETTKFKLMFDVAKKHFTDIINLAIVYDLALQETHVHKDRLDWIFWTLHRRKPDFIPQVRMEPLDDSRLELFYVVMGMIFLSQRTNNQPLLLPQSVSFRYNPNMIDKISTSIKNDLSLWADLFPYSRLDELARELKILHEQALSQQIRKDQDDIIKDDISVDKVSSFVRIFMQKWEESTLMRRILHGFGKVIDKTDELLSSNGGIILGYNQRHPKEDFTDNFRFDLQGLSEQYSFDLAIAEDKYIMSVIIENLEEVVIYNANILDLMENAIQDMRNSFYNPSSILVPNITTISLFSKSEKFRWNRDGNNTPQAAFAYFEEIPIYVIRSEVDNKIVVVDFMHFGRLEQLHVRDINYHPFSIIIRPFDENEVLRIYTDDLSLRRDNEGQFKSKQEIFREIQLEILLNISERLVFRIEKADAGRVIQF
jgi:hypothetical protein